MEPQDSSSPGCHLRWFGQELSPQLLAGVAFSFSLQQWPIPAARVKNPNVSACPLPGILNGSQRGTVPGGDTPVPPWGGCCPQAGARRFYSWFFSLGTGAPSTPLGPGPSRTLTRPDALSAPCLSLPTRSRDVRRLLRPLRKAGDRHTADIAPQPVPVTMRH